MTFSRKAQIAVAATDMVAILVASMLAAQMRLGMWYGSGMETFLVVDKSGRMSHCLGIGSSQVVVDVGTSLPG